MGTHISFIHGVPSQEGETPTFTRSGRRRRPARGRGHGGRGPGGRGPGRRRDRARRGAVGDGVMLVLSERSPLHGYELIAELEERSGGRWRPSPGSMYPTLGRLEHRGLIVGSEDDSGKRSYELTEEGRTLVANRDPDAPLPWSAEDTGEGSTLRPLTAEIIGQLRQVGRFGTGHQRAATIQLLEALRSDLYRVLADRGDDADGAATSEQA